jgi:imidazolonepropionase-like amidohydrolase
MRPALAALVGVVVIGSSGWKQETGNRRPGVFALRNATLSLDPTSTIERATIVLRGGLVEAAGGDLAVPADAEVIDATGLYVYAGFVDGLASAGLGDTKRSPEERKKAEATPADFVADSLGGMETANRKGIRPEFRAADVVVFGDEELKKHQRGGFTAVHVAASEEYLSGSAALVALSGGTRREIVVGARTGLAGSFRSYGDGYPSTPMGIMAHLRQVFLDSQRLRELAAAYDKDPKGRTRPPSDPALEALWPAFDRRLPFFMEANTALEIERALVLASEFKLDVVITGAREAGLVADRLKAAGVRVILSLKFPREPKRPKKPDAAEPKAGEVEEIPKPKKQYDDERREWERRVRSAIALHEAGVPFAFSTGGLDEPATALKQIGKLVSRGLPREAAVRALTATPAAILRAEAAYGKVAPGRPGNLTVLTAPLGSPEARARFVFADGKKFDLDPAGKAEADSEIDLTGAWMLTVEKSDAGPLAIKAELKQKGRELTGSVSSTTFGGGPITFGRVTGKSFSFSARIKVDGEDAELEVRGEKKDDGLDGKLSGPFGDGIAWKGKKIP